MAAPTAMPVKPICRTDRGKRSGGAGLKASALSELQLQTHLGDRSVDDPLVAIFLPQTSADLHTNPERPLQNPQTPASSDGIATGSDGARLTAPECLCVVLLQQTVLWFWSSSPCRRRRTEPPPPPAGTPARPAPAPRPWPGSGRPAPSPAGDGAPLGTKSGIMGHCAKLLTDVCN